MKMPKLLLVDNEPVRRTLTRYAILEIYKKEIEIFELPNGYEARDDILEINPDMVFMSVDMDHMDGVDTSVQMRKKGYNNPILLWTSRKELIHKHQRSYLQNIQKQDSDSIGILFGKEPYSKPSINVIKKYLGKLA
jgi:DNA-binding LytR/AlgR family response regulator